MMADRCLWQFRQEDEEWLKFLSQTDLSPMQVDIAGVDSSLRSWGMVGNCVKGAFADEEGAMIMAGEELLGEEWLWYAVSSK